MAKNPITFMLVKHTTIAAPPPAQEQEKPQESEKAEKVEEKEYPELPAGIKGEPYTGFEMPDDKGEFECENCEYFDYNSLSCGQETMMAKSTRPRLPNGRVIVHPEACCEFVNRLGKKDEDEDK